MIDEEKKITGVEARTRKRRRGKSREGGCSNPKP
jgi:hypothetical protein